MPLYVADYLADAAHLTATQHGAYLLLIMNYWQRGCPLPDDDRRLARIARVGPREWARMRDTISEFFSIADGAWVHNRIEHELARVSDKSLKSKKAAQASVQRRFGKRSTDVEPTDTDTDTSIPSSSDDGEIDPEKVIFDQGIKLLAANGIPEKRARPWLGKLKRDYDPADVIRALGSAKREGALDIIPWVEAALKAKAKTYDRDRITV
jgi:uncharacterized protein YdaU (DUF1376 family)